MNERTRDAATGLLGLAQSIVESAPDAMVIADEKGSIVLVNSQAEKLFGYPRAELVGEPVETLVPVRLRDQHRDQHRPAYGAARTSRPMGSRRELLALRKDGTEFPAEISLAPLETPGGILVSSVIRDVTERRTYEEALARKNVELQDALRIKGRFLAAMSHDLRTPLNAIIGFTGTLLMRLPGPLLPDQERQLKLVQVSGRQLLLVINNLLDLSRIDAGLADLRFGPVDGGDVVESAVAELRPIAELKGLWLTVATEGPLRLETDSDALRQIVWNMIDNAIRFTEKGGVRVACRRAPTANVQELEVSVMDTGHGIPEEQRARIFELPEPGDHRRGAMGIGLPLSQKLAALLGGRIEFESEVGRGSAFTLRLPESRP